MKFNKGDILSDPHERARKDRTVLVIDCNKFLWLPSLQLSELEAAEFENKCEVIGNIYDGTLEKI